ncbi:hypothetical protein JCM9957A_22730 [Kineosporia succinea]
MLVGLGLAQALELTDGILTHLRQLGQQKIPHRIDRHPFTAVIRIGRSAGPGPPRRLVVGGSAFYPHESGRRRRARRRVLARCPPGDDRQAPTPFTTPFTDRSRS